MVTTISYIFHTMCLPLLKTSVKHYYGLTFYGEKGLVLSKNICHGCSMTCLNHTAWPSLAAIIVYRLPWTWQFSKLTVKFVHAGLNLVAFVFAVVSLVAVFDFHNGANIPNMYSLHSWLGLIVVILYCLQVNKLV